MPACCEAPCPATNLGADLTPPVSPRSLDEPGVQELLESVVVLLAALSFFALLVEQRLAPRLLFDFAAPLLRVPQLELPLLLGLLLAAALFLQRLLSPGLFLVSQQLLAYVPLSLESLLLRLRAPLLFCAFLLFELLLLPGLFLQPVLALFGLQARQQVLFARVGPAAALLGAAVRARVGGAVERVHFVFEGHSEARVLRGRRAELFDQLLAEGGVVTVVLGVLLVLLAERVPEIVHVERIGVDLGLELFGEVRGEDAVHASLGQVSDLERVVPFDLFQRLFCVSGGYR